MESEVGDWMKLSRSIWVTDRFPSLARWRQAKSWELRAATSKARLWRDQGRRTRYLLAPVYGGFTEGSETFDLKETKALLNSLEF